MQHFVSPAAGTITDYGQLRTRTCHAPEAHGFHGDGTIECDVARHHSLMTEAEAARHAGAVTGMWQAIGAIRDDVASFDAKCIVTGDAARITAALDELIEAATLLRGAVAERSIRPVPERPAGAHHVFAAPRR
jgi:hypothetical protein